MSSEQPNEIHDQIGKLKTDLFKCIGTIESIQSKCRSRQHPVAETKQEIRGFVMIGRQRDFVMWLQEHDRKAREDVLTEATTRLQLILENPTKTLPWQIDPISQCIHLLNSLRSTQQQAGEQP